MKESSIINAWNLVTKFHSLKKVNFIPSLFASAWFLLVLFYQTVFALVYLFHWQDEALKLIIDFLHNEYVVAVVITVAIIFFGFAILHAVAV